MAEQENIRRIALEVLVEVCEHEAYVNRALGAALEKYAYLDKSKRAFLTRLVEGTLERRIELDFIIDNFSKVKVRKQKPLIRNLLRMSVYQLKYMDAVPDSAVCNEAVKLARSRGFSRLSGFVNGVLRTIAREPDPVEALDEKKDPEGYLSITCSVPRWLARQWVEAYGYERTKAILSAFLRDYPLTIRTNLRKCTPGQLRQSLEAQGVKVEPVGSGRLDYAFDITGYDRLEELNAFQEGLFYVQDLSSMLVVERVLEDFSGDGADPVFAIDVCAAPGGKATHLAQALGKAGCVEARDLTEAKVELIRENIEALELDNIRAVQRDALVFDEASADKADILICDLPCSGLGVIGKKTDIRYHMTPDKQQELAELQRQILDTVCAYVKPGGVMVYSTCTIGRAENEDNVQWFLGVHPEFVLEGMEQLFPGEENHDGFFLAKMTRMGKGNG